MSCYNNIPCLLHGSWLSNVQSVAPQLESHATENIMCRGFAAICMSSQRSASTPYTSQPVECKCHKVTLCRCQNQPAIGAFAASKTRPALTPFHLLALYHSMHSFSHSHSQWQWALVQITMRFTKVLHRVWLLATNDNLLLHPWTFPFLPSLYLRARSLIQCNCHWYWSPLIDCQCVCSACLFSSFHHTHTQRIYII